MRLGDRSTTPAVPCCCADSSKALDRPLPSGPRASRWPEHTAAPVLAGLSPPKVRPSIRGEPIRPGPELRDVLVQERRQHSARDGRYRRLTAVW
jgi:hypothetical protein